VGVDEVKGRRDFGSGRRVWQGNLDQSSGRESATIGFNRRATTGESMSNGSVPPDPVPEGRPPIRFIAFDDLEEVVGEPPGFDGVQLNRRIFDLASSGTPHLIADVITFKPDFIHHMHRHFNADQVMVPLQGSVVMLDEARAPRELGVGEAMAVPRLRWHEVRNQSGADCVVLNLFPGVGDMSEVGFEAFPRE
jgi:quercetin dioxygenase-like cupin family protein